MKTYAKKLAAVALVVLAIMAFGCSAEGNIDDRKGGVKVEGDK